MDVVVAQLHVDFDFQWTGSDPASEFKLIAKLGQGYCPPPNCFLRAHIATRPVSSTTQHTRAYGKVYKAEHKDTGFILAIKCIPIPEELAEDAEKARVHASFTCAALRS